MKNKRLLALLLAAVMTVSVTAVAFAEETTTPGGNTDTSVGGEENPGGGEENPGGNVVVDTNYDYDFFGTETWDEVKEEVAQTVEDMREGTTIKLSGVGLRNLPSSVIRALKGKDITLEIRKNGVTYTINGLKIGNVNKLWYDFDDLSSFMVAADDK